MIRYAGCVLCFESGCKRDRCKRYICLASAILYVVAARIGSAI